MRRLDAFEDLVQEAERIPIQAWDFSWLADRALEVRPSWRFFELVSERASRASQLLEVQAGTGSMIGALPSLPPLAVATEGFAPSVAVAAPRLRSRGAHLVVTSQVTPGLPFSDGVFDLVISRHPTKVWWYEISRVLPPGGTYLAQHVGPHSLRSLTEVFTGPLPEGSQRAPEVEREAAESAGLIVETMNVERPPVAFYDVGAVVYFLRLVPWIVPNFTVAGYRDVLYRLHHHIEQHGAFETTASRTLVEARKPGHE